jgi:hypothetical protein
MARFFISNTTLHEESCFIILLPNDETTLPPPAHHPPSRYDVVCHRPAPIFVRRPVLLPGGGCRRRRRRRRRWESHLRLPPVRVLPLQIVVRVPRPRVPCESEPPPGNNGRQVLAVHVCRPGVLAVRRRRAVLLPRRVPTEDTPRRANRISSIS